MTHLFKRIPSIERESLRLLFASDSSSDIIAWKKAIETGNIIFTSDVAATQEDYISLLQNNNYNAVLSVYQSSKLNYFEALKLLKQTSQDIPILVITEPLGDERAVACIKEGITNLVLKEDL